MKQITSRVIMIRPINFGFNPETAENNAFQSEIFGLKAQKAQSQALKEFDNFVELLRIEGIDVEVFEDNNDSFTPDSIFPNNWFTTHEDNVIITYPMFSENRRSERREDILDTIKPKNTKVKRYGFEYFEEEDKFLEGTGSMILDREHRIAYACLSDRTHVEVMEKFCVLRNYKKVFFYSFDKDGNEVYHTNVMMSVGESFVLICLDSVKDEDEKKVLLSHFTSTNKEIIDITFDQMHSFAGNIIQLKNKQGNRFIVMSQTAKDSLSVEQVDKLTSHGKIISPNINTIETLGGGSARCMLAEDFFIK
jgi:hypothetical protein